MCLHLTLSLSEQFKNILKLLVCLNFIGFLLDSWVFVILIGKPFSIYIKNYFFQAFRDLQITQFFKKKKYSVHFFIVLNNLIMSISSHYFPNNFNF